MLAQEFFVFTRVRMLFSDGFGELKYMFPYKFSQQVNGRKSAYKETEAAKSHNV